MRCTTYTIFWVDDSITCRAPAPGESSNATSFLERGNLGGFRGFVDCLVGMDAASPCQDFMKKTNNRLPEGKISMSTSSNGKGGWKITGQMDTKLTSPSQIPGS